jgi:uncharacterized protein YoxC
MATPQNNNQYAVILERLELVHGLVARLNEIDKSFSVRFSNIEQTQQRTLDLSSQEFQGMRQIQDKLSTKIESLETEQIKESRRTDDVSRRVDDLFRSYGVNVDDTKNSVKRINERVDGINTKFDTLLDKMNEMERKNEGNMVMSRWIIGGVSGAISLIGYWLLNQFLGGIK